MGKQWGITYNVRDYSVVYGLDSGAQWRNIASEEYPYSIVQTETTIKNSIDFEINEPLMIFVAQTTSSSDGITDNYILKQKTINKNNKNILRNPSSVSKSLCVYKFRSNRQKYVNTCITASKSSHEPQKITTLTIHNKNKLPIIISL